MKQTASLMTEIGKYTKRLYAFADDLIVEDEDVAAERERIRKTNLNKLQETDNLILRYVFQR